MASSRIAAAECARTPRYAVKHYHHTIFSDPHLTLAVYTHVASEDDARIAGQLGRILHPFAPTEKGKGFAPIEQTLVN
jgi:hypothetical protein